MTHRTTVGEVSPRLSSTLAELTSEVVVSFVARNAVPTSEVTALIATVHGAFADLMAPRPDVPVQPLKPAVPIRKSVTDAHIVSLEDGRPYKTLVRHLAKFGMTPADYRAKWSLPANYPMTSPAYSRARSALAKEMGLGALRRKR